MNAQEQDTRADGQGGTEKPRRRKGKGCVFSRPDSPVLWIKYSRRGRTYRESTGTNDERKAEKLLELRVAQIKTNTFTEPKFERVRVAELFEDVERDYRTNKFRSLDDLQTRWNLHLKPVFADLRAIECGTDDFTCYTDARQQAGAADGLINRELSILKRMFSLGRICTPPKVLHVPYIPMLKETNRRKGFLKPAQHDRLAAACGKIGLWLEAIFETGYTYGWRDEEVKGLQVWRVDLLGDTIHLEPLSTKNDDPREATLTPRLRVLLAACVAGKGPNDFVFTRGKKPVKDFRDSWSKACAAAGVAGLYFHDLRRTAAKNMRKAGVAESVIMNICGWRTADVFRRYGIVDNSDSRDAMAKLEAYRQSQKLAAQAEISTRIGHVDDLEAVQPTAEAVN